MNMLPMIVEWCQPPASPDLPETTDLFANFNLTMSPPEDLGELYRTYGLGRFTCDSNALKLLNPQHEAPDILRGLVNLAPIVADTRPKLAAILVNGSPIPTNFIAWGYDENAVIFASAYLSDVLGWCSILIGESLHELLCYFNPSEILMDCIAGALPPGDGGVGSEREVRTVEVIIPCFLVFPSTFTALSTHGNLLP
jgi:hypothetical protein